MIKELVAIEEKVNEHIHTQKLKEKDLRDWFAGMAMQGLLTTDGKDDYSGEGIAMIAYEQADAMMKEREK